MRQRHLHDAIRRSHAEETIDRGDPNGSPRIAIKVRKRLRLKSAGKANSCVPVNGAVERTIPPLWGRDRIAPPSSAAAARIAIRSPDNARHRCCAGSNR